MYVFFRLLGLVGVIALLTGIVLKLGHFSDSNVPLFIAYACIGVAFFGRKYMDHKNKNKSA